MTTKKKQPTLKSLEAEIAGLKDSLKATYRELHQKADNHYCVGADYVPYVVGSSSYGKDKVTIEDLVIDYERRRRRNKTLKKFLKACGIGIVLILATVGSIYLIKGGC